MEISISDISSDSQVSITQRAIGLHVAHITLNSSSFGIKLLALRWTILATSPSTQTVELTGPKNGAEFTAESGAEHQRENALTSLKFDW